MLQKASLRAGSLSVGVAVLVVACSAASGTSDRANASWADRLTRQALSIQQEQQLAQRARDAWSQRLQAQAGSLEQEHARLQRASQAWSIRLTGLARRSGSS